MRFFAVTCGNDNILGILCQKMYHLGLISPASFHFFKRSELDDFTLQLVATSFFLGDNSVLAEAQHTSLVKSQAANISGFPGQMVVFVASIQLCCCNR